MNCKGNYQVKFIPLYAVSAPRKRLNTSSAHLIAPTIRVIWVRILRGEIVSKTSSVEIFPFFVKAARQ